MKGYDGRGGGWVIRWVKVSGKRNQDCDDEGYEGDLCSVGMAWTLRGVWRLLGGRGKDVHVQVDVLGMDMPKLCEPYALHIECCGLF